jgi:outer membrane receptor protein involved in Fe transport
MTTTLAAQRATFVGIVRDSATGVPVSDATVEVLEQAIVAVTDSGGRFRLEGVGGGHFTIYVQRLGYFPGIVELEFTATRAMTVDLGEMVVSPVATELDPVVVEAEAFNERLQEVGFFGRRHTETGTFITRDDIVKQNPSTTSELLRRVPGFRVFVDGNVSSARGVPSISHGFSQCGVQYYVDGVHADGSDLNTVLPRAIAGMEIYTGSASIPPIYRVSGNPKCGVVLIWTRSGGRSP